jgi:hypothetical protein
LDLGVVPLLGQGRGQRRGHLPQFLHAPADAVLLPQAVQGPLLRHAGFAEDHRGPLGQRRRGAVDQAEGPRQGEERGVAALVRGAVADPPEPDGAEQGPGVLCRLGVEPGVRRRFAVDVLGQGPGVGRLQVVVGVLDEGAAALAQRVLELPLEVACAGGGNGPGAEGVDEFLEA